MFVILWHYLKGYVIVEVSGGRFEQLLNLLMVHSAYIWDLKKTEEIVSFKISIYDFKRMKKDVRKSRCHVRIIEKRGLPFVLNRYAHRKMFMIGIFVFMALIWTLSSFVWLVEVEGAQTISNIDIIETLEEKGYRTGRLKGKMNLREAEAYLMQQYPDIVWTGIHFEGTKIVVRIAETVPAPSLERGQEEAADWVAKRDALVTYIAVKKGMPKVKVGDTVKKGDVLVTGSIPYGEENPGMYYIRSKAQVIGKTFYSSQKSLSFKQTYKQYTSQTSKKYTLKCFDYALTLLNQKPPSSLYDRQTTLKQLRITNMFPLPFGLEVETRVGYKPSYKTLSEEQAKDLLLSQMWSDIEKHLNPKAKVLQREVVYKKTEDGLVGTLYVVAEEEIGYEVIRQNEGELTE